MKVVPVIIVGGGPVGLSMALALARQNVRSLLVERHPSTTQHPRARGVNVRTMELFRQWGNADNLLAYEQPKEARRIIWAKSFQGEEVTRVILDDSNIDSHSPTQSSLVSQDKVEESLYHSLQKYEEAEVYFLKEFISFEERDSEIIVKILDRKTNQEEWVSAQYLIAADGAHSPIRNQLEILMEGQDNMGQFCNVYCEIDISEWTRHRPFIGMFFVDPNLSGRLLASVDGMSRWIVGLRFSQKNSNQDFTDEYCISEIRRMLDLPTLQVKIINKSFWTMAALMAKEYRRGRVFLVGDAAHRLPPTGGFGMNTGIQDAHNLAWKLAFVIKWGAPDRLLNTYYDERAPIAEHNIKWSTENANRFDAIYEAIHSGNFERLKAILHEQNKNLNNRGLDLGFIYHSNAILSENDQHLSLTPAHYVPTTLPGSRAPHMKILKEGKTISILDLFEKDFALLFGPEGHPWKNAAHELIDSFPFPIKIYHVAESGDLGDLNDLEGSWYTHYGMTATGALLVRPDGHVAWRSKSLADNPKAVLTNVLNIIGCLQQ